MPTPTHTTPARPSGGSRGSDAITDGIRVEVEPAYLASYSDPAAARFIFRYCVRITNGRDERVRVTRRFWRVVDGNGVEHTVDQPGVVGQRPFLEPGASFEYTSYCPMSTPWGTMEGHYLIERDGAEPMQAAISRFYLVGPSP